MKYTKIPENAFKELQLNAGVLLTDFDTKDGMTEQELLAAVEQTVQAAKQRMYVRRFPGTQTGCGDDEKGREKERQFFHFRQRICTNITIKSMQKQIIRPVLFV